MLRKLHSGSIAEGKGGKNVKILKERQGQPCYDVQRRNDLRLVLTKRNSPPVSKYAHAAIQLWRDNSAVSQNNRSFESAQFIFLISCRSKSVLSTDKVSISNSIGSVLAEILGN